MHFTLQARRQRSPHNQLALKSGRQPVALGQSWRKIVVMRTIPIVQVAIVVAIITPILATIFTPILTPVRIATMFLMTVSMAVPMAMVVIVVAISKCRCEPNAQHQGCTR